MVKTIVIDGKEYQLKDEIKGIEFLNKLPARYREGMLTNVELLVDASGGVLTKKYLLTLSYAEFIRTINQFAKIYGLPQDLDFLGQK